MNLRLFDIPLPTVEKQGHVSDSANTCGRFRASKCPKYSIDTDDELVACDFEKQAEKKTLSFKLAPVLKA